MDGMTNWWMNSFSYPVLKYKQGCRITDIREQNSLSLFSFNLTLANTFTGDIYPVKGPSKMI